MPERSDFTGNRIKLLALGVALAVPLGALAQYKVVGPNGAVSYTDRPPARAPGKVEPIDPPTTLSQASATAGLPFELRQVATRYPVALYAQKICEACEAGRQYLRQRGIPHIEKLVDDGDGEALERATGSRQVPALTIGNQVLRGFSADQWASYLDAAGYPKQSRLPANYAAPSPTPLVVRTVPAPAAAVPAIPPVPVAPPPAPGGIRF